MKYLCIVARKINCFFTIYSLKILLLKIIPKIHSNSFDRVEEQCNNFFFLLSSECSYHYYAALWPQCRENIDC